MEKNLQNELYTDLRNNGGGRRPNRLLNYDLLRLLAAYLIVVLHLSVQYINKAPASMEEYMVWQQAIKFSALSRVGVPVFVMLSGAFLLTPDKEISLVTIFRKYLPKLIAIFLLWSAFYTLKEQGYLDEILERGMNDIPEIFAHADWEAFWSYFLQGHYHLWYLYMLAGLYLATPLLKHIAAHATKAQLVYFVGLCAAVTSLSKLNEGLWENQLLEAVMDKLSLSVFFGYVGYFVAGYLFRQYTPSWIWTLIFAFAGMSAFKFTYTETWELNPMFGFETPNLVFFSNYSPTVFLMSFGIFAVTAKLGGLLINRKGRLLDIIGAVFGRLAKYLLVVYLVHPAVIAYCRGAELLAAPTTAVSLLENAATVYFISLLISLVITEALNLVKNSSRLVLSKIK